MYIIQHRGNIVFLIEWRLCRRCMRMFCASKEPHVIMRLDGMFFHTHVDCPPLKERNPLILIKD